VVAAGDGMLAPTVTRRLIEAFASGNVAPVAPATTVLDALTPRELDVLMLVTRGMSNAEIGQELGVATGTVKAHINAVLGKLGVRDRVQATILAYDMGLVRPRTGPA
jgi:DNA-binding NarL/FixJ family response regulator